MCEKFYRNLENINLDIVLSILIEFIEFHVRNATEHQAKWTYVLIVLIIEVNCFTQNY
jgi:hypothetical protein